MSDPVGGAQREEDARVVGAYTLTRRLGTGGIGEVWLGRSALSGGLAAIKVLRRERARGRESLIARERRVIGRLSHPHIVRLFDVGADYIATTYIDGSDLQRRLRTPIAPELALRIAGQVGSALAYAHSQGVVHRDVKPANILIDREDNAFLADFGLAAIAGEADGIGGGTPAYMAPEVSRGEPGGPEADQYGLALCVLQMLAGGELPANPRAAIEALPETLRQGVGPPLLRALDQDAARRFESVDALVDALQAAEIGESEGVVRRAPVRRPEAPFRWVAHPTSRTAVSPEIARCDHRLSALEAAGALPPGAGEAFRRAHGFADFGWAMFARTDRLGPADAPGVLASAGDVVVLIHGWLGTRDVWSDVAAAVCRDNAQAVVLVPDVNGLGESCFADPRPPLALATPAAMAQALLEWLALLGVRGLPTVLVGHSMGGNALLTLEADVYGEQTRRIVLTPYIREAAPRTRFNAWLAAHLLRWLGGFFKWLGTWFSLGVTGSPDMSADMRERMMLQFQRIAPGVLSALLFGLAGSRVTSHALRAVTLILGERDPAITPERVRKLLPRFALSEERVHVLPSAGHFPHVARHDHPEWTARNQDEIVRIIDQVLLESQQSPLDPTLPITPADG